MKLIFGQWTRRELEELQQELERWASRGQHAVLFPYHGDPPTIVDLEPIKRPWQRWVSIHAHKATK